MTEITDSNLRRRRRANSASSNSSTWSYDKVDWEAHEQNAPTQPDTTEGSETTEPDPGVHSSTTTKPDRACSLLNLPPEILLHLIPHLPYPSLLALRLTHPHFFHSPLFYPSRATAIRLKVSWLATRRHHGLAVPQNSRLSFETDAAFLSNTEVAQALRREAHHSECAHSCRVTGLNGLPCNGPRRGRGAGWNQGVLSGFYVDIVVPSYWERLAVRSRLGRSLERSRMGRVLSKSLTVVGLSAIFAAGLWTISLALAGLGWTLTTLGTVSGGSIAAVSIATAGFLVGLGERRAARGWRRRQR